MSVQIDKLTLVAGVKIPVPELKVNIHQPTIREIAIVGEERFYKALSLFDVGKDAMAKALSSEIYENQVESIELVKKELESMSDFEVLLQVLNQEELAKQNFQIILTLLMPEHSFEFEEKAIIGYSVTGMVRLDETSFLHLKDIVKIIFCLDRAAQEEFNPQDDRAKAIADKLKKAREKVRIAKGETQSKDYILANYISALGIGANALNMLNAVSLTVYQLFDQMQRYGLYVQNDFAGRAAMAGAKDVEMVDWLKNL